MDLFEDPQVIPEFRLKKNVNILFSLYKPHEKATVTNCRHIGFLCYLY